MRSSIYSPSLMQRRRKARMRELLLFTRALNAPRHPQLRLVSG